MLVRRLVIIFILAFNLLPHGATWAQGNRLSEVPELNPLCWQEADCIDVRKDFGVSDEEAGEGWLKNREDCMGEKWGMCLPPGRTKSKIALGGRSDFLNVGEYILTVYRYSMGVVGILAIVVIIIAGLQWMTSAGNSTTIASAKKRIGGAIIGLLIAYGSFFILNTINPALISLRLPESWMVRPSSLVPTYCVELDSDNQLAKAGKSSDQIDPKKAGQATYNLTPSSTTQLACGQKFFVENSNGQTCQGNYCKKLNPDRGVICLPDINTLTKANPGYLCNEGTIAGIVKDSSILGGWSSPPLRRGTWKSFGIEGYGALIGVCQNGDVEDIKGILGRIKNLFGVVNVKENVVDLPDGKSQAYNFSYPLSQLKGVETTCASKGGLKGFALVLSFDYRLYPGSQLHVIGRNGVDLGDYIYLPGVIPILHSASQHKIPDLALGFFARHSQNIDDKYFFTLKEVSDGVLLDVDASRIRRMSSTDYYDAQHKEAYDYLLSSNKPISPRAKRACPSCR